MTTFNALAEMLLSDDPGTRNQAIYAIGEAHADHPLAVEALARLLRDESKVATHAATLRALGKLGGEAALAAITGMLTHDHATIRDTAAQVLGDMRHPGAVEALLRMLTSERGPIRATAVEALGKSRDARAVRPLIAALRDERADVRFQAARGLGVLSAAGVETSPAVGPLIEALDDYAMLYEGAVAEVAAESLAVIDDPHGNDAVARWRAVWDIFADAPETEALIGYLDHENWEIRHTAALILGERGEQRGVDALIAALDDADPDVRRAGAESLGKLAMFYGADVVATVDPLLALLDRETVIDVRRKVVEALGRIGDPRIVPILIALLPDQTGDLDFKTAEALELIGTKEARRAAQGWRKALDRDPRYPPPPRAEG